MYKKYPLEEQLLTVMSHVSATVKRERERYLVACSTSAVNKSQFGVLFLYVQLVFNYLLLMGH